MISGVSIFFMVSFPWFFRNLDLLDPKQTVFFWVVPKGQSSQRQRCLAVIGSYQSEGEGQLIATRPASAIPGWIRSCLATLLICGVLNGS